MLLLLGILFAHILGIEIDFKLTVIFLSATMVFTFIDAYKITPIQDDGSQLYKLINILRISLIVSPVIFILFGPYYYGKNEAKALLSGKHNLNTASLGSYREKWLLLEMNGDKALLVNKENLKSFKLVEYKDVKELNAP